MTYKVDANKVKIFLLFRQHNLDRDVQQIKENFDFLFLNPIFSMFLIDFLKSLNTYCKILCLKPFS